MASNLFVWKFSLIFFLSFLRQTLFVSHKRHLDLITLYLWFQRDGCIMSHVKHSSWLIESERLMQASTLCLCQAANHSGSHCSLSQCILKSISVNTQLSTLSSHIRSPRWHGGLTFPHFQCVIMCVLQHCRKLRRELWHRERVWGLREQRLGQLCGQVRRPLHRQGVHRERSDTGSHQEPAQHDPRYSARSVHSHSATALIPSALCRVTLGCVCSRLRPTAVEASELINS